MAQESTWLTQEAFDRLTSELAELEGPTRAAIVERIAAARDEGDLKENGGYHAAREEQAKNEGRILELKQKLRNVTIGAKPDDGIVEQGMLVEVNLAGKPMKFLLGSRELGDTASVDVYSPASPLGKAINGRRVGDDVQYTAPNGKSFNVKILATSPYSG